MANIAKFRPFPSTKFFPNSLFDDFFNRSIADFVGSDALVTQPAVNILETNAAFKLEVAAPGFEKQDFSLDVENDYLTVRAQRERQKDDAAERVTRREFRFDAFERSFKLPATVNQEMISAVYENGVLIVTIPKKEEAKSVVKTIEIGG